MELVANLKPLGIGSMPFSNVEFCSDIILKYYNDFPYWPQLPNLIAFENMYIQYSEGLPGCVLDIKKGSIFIDTKKITDKDREEFYSNIIQNNYEYFKISKTFSVGLYFLKKIIEEKNIDYIMLKGHVTGPVSFGLTLTDENKKSMIYNDEYRDIITELIAMKGRWQEEFFNEDMIVFFDEPYMVSYGSAFFNMPEDVIIEMFNRCFNKVKGVPGIHCCGNTDWSLILKTDVDIINFDAYLYMDNFLLYAKEIKKFIEKGGFLAWGLIPTSEEINNCSEKKLETIFDKAIASLTKAGIDKEQLLRQSFITPSCGTGSMTEDNALKVFNLNLSFSLYLRKKYNIRS